MGFSYSFFPVSKSFCDTADNNVIADYLNKNFSEWYPKALNALNTLFEALPIVHFEAAVAIVRNAISHLENLEQHLNAKSLYFDNRVNRFAKGVEEEGGMDHIVSTCRDIKNHNYAVERVREMLQEVRSSIKELAKEEFDLVDVQELETYKKDAARLVREAALKGDDL